MSIRGYLVLVGATGRSPACTHENTASHKNTKEKTASCRQRKAVQSQTRSEGLTGQRLARTVAEMGLFRANPSHACVQELFRGS